MPFNLVEVLQNTLGNQISKLASSAWNESEANTQKAVNAAIPAILTGFLNKGTNIVGAQNLITKLNSESDASVLDTIKGLVDENFDFSTILSKGSSIIQYLFGDKTDSVTDLISGFSGVKKESSFNILKLAAPFIFSWIGQKVSGDNMNAGGLMNFMINQKNNIMSAAPAGFQSLLGLSAIPGNTPSNPTTSKESSGGGFKWWPWLLLGLAALALLLFLRGCDKKEAENAMDQTAQNMDQAADSLKNMTNNAIDSIGSATDKMADAIKGKLNEFGDFVADLGNIISVKLPDGKEMKVGENSVEARLIKFIQDPNRPVDKETWFSFDRLYFETGSANLKKESEEQLKNIAFILQAFPNVNIKLGGYTDNTGEAAMNQKLSQQRADNTLRRLKDLGVALNRLSAEGYGPEHPICPANDTPECKARNRRIDIRVTKK